MAPAAVSNAAEVGAAMIFFTTAMASALVVAAGIEGALQLAASSTSRVRNFPPACQACPREIGPSRRMFSSRTARDYMRLARAPIPKTATVAAFGINAALEAVREQPEVQKSAAAAHFGINAALEALREKPQREGDGELGASTCSELLQPRSSPIAPAVPRVAFDGAPAARAGADEKPAIGPLAAGRAIRAGRNTPLSRLLRAYASAQKSPAVSNAAPIFTPREGDGRVAQTIRPSSREASFIAAPEGTFLPAEASFLSTFCKRG